jgi:hypothetical protein
VLVDWLAALLGETSLLGERAATPLRELLASPVNHDMDDEARHADEALM